ncbi:hypothetical protein PG357_10020 [Riemerella anatipestifer]|nr:hypothetical protein [Riemerella anatipestifer]
MIRFLDLKGQIIDDYPTFAFYDTIRDRIIEFSGKQVFDSIEEFELYYHDEFKNNTNNFPIERFLSLIPKNFFE